MVDGAGFEPAALRGIELDAFPHAGFTVPSWPVIFLPSGRSSASVQRVHRTLYTRLIYPPTTKPAGDKRMVKLVCELSVSK